MMCLSERLISASQSRPVPLLLVTQGSTVAASALCWVHAPLLPHSTCTHHTCQSSRHCNQTRVVAPPLLCHSHQLHIQMFLRSSLALLLHSVMWFEGCLSSSKKATVGFFFYKVPINKTSHELNMFALPFRALKLPLTRKCVFLV